MPDDEYASTVRGGLKLKGAKPSGVTKKKSKKKSKPAASPDAGSEGKNSAPQKASPEDDAEASKASEGNELDEAQLRELEPRGEDGKTASERQFEEVRRRRLQDRVAREGTKTHKQRVEELNKYLSTLSEHHDMPRIGPG